MIGGRGDNQLRLHHHLGLLQMSLHRNSEATKQAFTIPIVPERPVLQPKLQGKRYQSNWIICEYRPVEYRLGLEQQRWFPFTIPTVPERPVLQPKLQSKRYQSN
jgi:hypothetical protein